MFLKVVELEGGKALITLAILINISKVLENHLKFFMAQLKIMSF